MRKSLRIALAVAALVTLLAFDMGPAMARSRTRTHPFRGFNGVGDDETAVFTGVATSTCTTTYCARFKAGRREKRVTVRVWDDVTESVLFAVGQDKNRDGDALDRGEYKIFCGDGSISIKPGKNVDVQVLAGGYANEHGHLFCISAPIQGKITYTFS